MKVLALTSIARGICVIVLLAFSCLNSANAETKSQRVVHRLAMVIGNAKYSGAPWESLNSPVKDADDIGELFQNAGYKVFKGTNLSGSSLYLEINKFLLEVNKRRVDIEERGAKANESIVVLFYYSGHGMAEQHNPYLVGSDGSGQYLDDVRAKSYNAAALLRKLSGDDNEVDTLSILMIDACRQGVNLPPKPTSQSKQKGGAFTKGALDGSVGRGMLAIFGSGDGRPSYDGRSSSHNSLFTEAILAAAKEDKEKPLLLTDFFQKVKATTIEISRSRQFNPSQSPEIRDNLETVDVHFSVGGERRSARTVEAINQAEPKGALASGWVWVGNYAPPDADGQRWSRINFLSPNITLASSTREVGVAKAVALDANLNVRAAFPGDCEKGKKYPNCAPLLGVLPKGAKAVVADELRQVGTQVWAKVVYDPSLIYKDSK